MSQKTNQLIPLWKFLWQKSILMIIINLKVFSVMDFCAFHLQWYYAGLDFTGGLVLMSFGDILLLIVLFNLKWFVKCSIPREVYWYSSLILSVMEDISSPLLCLFISALLHFKYFQQLNLSVFAPCLYSRPNSVVVCVTQSNSKGPLRFCQIYLYHLYQGIT